MRHWQPTLHAARKTILLSQAGHMATFRFLTGENAKRDLFRRLSDGRHPPPTQLRVRARHPQYRSLFELVPPDAVKYIGPE